jgi:hypothetical protein
VRRRTPRGDAVLGVYAVERADELVLHGAAPYRDGAQREQPGRDREQRAEHWRAVGAWRGRPPAPPGRGLDEVDEHADELGLEPAQPIGARTTVGNQLRDGAREPAAIVVGDDARADECEQQPKTGRGRRILRSRRRHGASLEEKRRNSDSAERPVPVQENGYDVIVPSTTRRPPRCSSA